MNASSEQQRELYAILQALIGPVMGGAISKIANVAGFRLPESAGSPFVDFVRWINTRLAFIEGWKANSIYERRKYRRFMIVADGIVLHMQQHAIISLAALKPS